MSDARDENLIEREAPRRSVEAGAVRGERSISPVGASSGMTGKALAVAALTGAGLLFLATTWGHDKPKKPATAPQPARQTVAFEPARPDQMPPSLATTGQSGQPGAAAVGPDGQVVPAIQPGAAGSAPTSSSQMTPAQKAAALMESARRAPLTAYAANQGPGLPGEAGTGLLPAVGDVVPTAAAASEPSELDRLRRGSTIAMARATQLPDRNFLITAGTNIPCILQTAMDTSAPGYVTCLIPNDVYSDNGSVVLMEKGTKVLGEYHSGMTQGQNRLFVLWDRAVTPKGVAIALASPASDSLGRAGFDGAIDTQFWKRFGGALLFSIVDDASNIASQHLANGELNYTTTVPSQAASIALQNSINIGPILRKNQGSEVSILVAQDFNFSGVYGLHPR